MKLIYNMLIIPVILLTACESIPDKNCNLLYSNFNKTTEFNNIDNIGVYTFDIKEKLISNETYNIEIEFKNIIDNPEFLDNDIKIAIIALISDFDKENKLTNNIKTNNLLWKFSTEMPPYFNVNSKNYIKSSFTVPENLNLNNLNLTVIAAYGKNIIISNENVNKWVLLKSIPKLDFNKINLQNIQCAGVERYDESYGETQNAKN